MLPIKKIFIDSKAKVAGSKSTSNFIIDLPESYTMPEDCAFHIDDVCIPCSWYLIREGFNDSMVIATKDPNVLAPNDKELYYQIIIAPGQYDGESLASAIQNQMPSHNPQIGHFAEFSPYEFDVKFFSPSSQIIISGKRIGAPRDCYFKVLTDADILRVLNATTWRPSTNRPTQITQFYSINTLIGNTGNVSTEQRQGTDFKSKSIDFRPIKYVLIRSPNFGTFMTLNSLHGEKTVVKKVQTQNAKFGDIISDYIRSSEDLLDCSKQSLRRLEFRFSDEAGNDLDLNGQDVSFSIVFSLKAKE